MDPPYYELEGYGIPFPIDEYRKIAESMRAMKGSAILTINDHPEMKLVFKGFTTETVEIDYTIGGSGTGKKRREMIVRNW